jgi:hypothetical protein
MNKDTTIRNDPMGNYLVRPILLGSGGTNFCHQTRMDRLNHPLQIFAYLARILLSLASKEQTEMLVFKDMTTMVTIWTVLLEIVLKFVRSVEQCS